MTSRTMEISVSGDGESLSTAISTAWLKMEGPQIAASIAESRGLGIPDAEILDVLVERLTRGWY